MYYHINMDFQWNLHWLTYMSTQFGAFNQVYWKVFQVIKMSIVFMHLISMNPKLIFFSHDILRSWPKACQILN
jgi:hypothetical protein